MSELQPHSEERLVITAGEVAQAGVAPPPPERVLPPAAPDRTGAVIPWWSVLLASCLAVCLPLLCLFAIGIRVGIRQRDLRIRAAWNGLLCTLLVISGLL